jgi:hypothetical protein
MLIPKKEIVRFVLKNVLKGKKIRSQQGLAKAIENKLKETEIYYSISPQRARMIAIETPGINVKIINRKGIVPKKCPACNHNLKKIYSKNLKGRKSLTGMKCSKCSYIGSGNRWIPGRYEFELTRTG